MIHAWINVWGFSLSAAYWWCDANVSCKFYLFLSEAASRINQQAILSKLCRGRRGASVSGLEGSRDFWICSEEAIFAQYGNDSRASLSKPQLLENQEGFRKCSVFSFFCVCVSNRYRICRAMSLCHAFREPILMTCLFFCGHFGQICECKCSVASVSVV